MNKRFALSAGLAAVALAGLTTAALAVPAAATTRAADAEPIHEVYCQSGQYPDYFRFYLSGVPTPGGGPLCFTGRGTIALRLHHVVRFDSGAHSGSFDTGFPPALVLEHDFGPGQAGNITGDTDVSSLTLD